jgi:hypothetical protein
VGGPRKSRFAAKMLVGVEANESFAITKACCLLVLS